MGNTLQVSLPIRLVTLVSLLVLLSILGSAWVVISGLSSNSASAAVLYDEEAVVRLYETASPAVMEINVTQQTTGFFRFSLPVDSQGSGFLVDSEGHILTNYHVVRDASRIRVTLSNGRVLSAEVVGTSPADDLALLKVDPEAVSGIEPLLLGDSSSVRPGQMAIALGSPFGLENSITVGVVSGVGRTRSGSGGRPITDMIQTDASINPGNSGGPLLNSLGEVIGINTSIQASANGATSVGFAVSSNTALDVLAQLLESAIVNRPWLGISGVAMTSDLADALGFGVRAGVYVVTVVPDSPAEAAGLVGAGLGTNGAPGPGGDIITAVDGEDVRSVEDIVRYLNTLRPGDTVELSVARGEQSLGLSVVLELWPDE